MLYLTQNVTQEDWAKQDVEAVVGLHQMKNEMESFLKNA
tara:strand:+ start:1335 stop:1451 length:117 start_codon:yes stop_codon:yes gene_type:complete